MSPVRMPLFAALALALLTPVGAGALEAKAWDQAKATELARSLSQAAESLHRQARLEENQPWATKRANNYLLVEDLRGLRRHTRALVRHLEQGEGREGTQRLFDRILAEVQNARDNRRSAPLLQDAQAEIDAARAVLETLATYYGRELPPPAQ